VHVGRESTCTAAMLSYARRRLACASMERRSRCRRRRARRAMGPPPRHPRRRRRRRSGASDWARAWARWRGEGAASGRAWCGRRCHSRVRHWASVRSSVRRGGPAVAHAEFSLPAMGGGCSSDLERCCCGGGGRCGS
jgi:hypothetical protein